MIDERSNVTGHETELPAPGGIRLVELGALVVGYSLAALLVRAYFSSSAKASIPTGCALALEFLWLGLAMSGPFVLILRRRQAPTPRVVLSADGNGSEHDAPTPQLEDSERSTRFTGPELSWLLVGSYWIGITLLVVPSRLPSASMPVLGLAPFLAASLLALMGRKRSSSAVGRPGWTHRAAIIMLTSWPLAWIALIALTSVM
jgi:hypothetical protein